MYAQHEPRMLMFSGVRPRSGKESCMYVAVAKQTTFEYFFRNARRHVAHESSKRVYQVYLKNGTLTHDELK